MIEGVGFRVEGLGLRAKPALYVFAAGSVGSEGMDVV